MMYGTEDMRQTQQMIPHNLQERVRRELEPGEIIRWMKQPVPARLLRCMLGERAALLLGSQRALPIKAGLAGYHFRYPHLIGALQDLTGAVPSHA